MKFLFFLIAILVSLYSSAYDFEKDGIYYEITETSGAVGPQVSVTCKTNNADSCENKSKVGCYKGKVVIPSTVVFKNRKFKVTTIGSMAFKGCSYLKSIVIGKNVIKIGDKAFEGCERLKKITCKSVLPPEVVDGGFTKLQFVEIDVFVPENSKNAYEMSPCWCEFSCIQTFKSSATSRPPKSSDVKDKKNEPVFEFRGVH